MEVETHSRNARKTAGEKWRKTKESTKPKTYIYIYIGKLEDKIEGREIWNVRF